MHRVELKAVGIFGCPAIVPWFLMHRVELKALALGCQYTGRNSAFLMHHLELKKVVRKCLILVFYKLYDALGGAHII